jgi:hypothetical protein
MRQDRIVLMEDRSNIDAERYTLKKYHSRKVYAPDGTWEHEEISLLPLNFEHAAIPSQIERVEPPHYPPVAEGE